MGRLEESLEQVKLGRQYDPLSPIAVSPVVGHLLFLRRYDEVIHEARALLEADPDFPWLQSFLASALRANGARVESLDVWRAQFARRPKLAAALERGHLEPSATGARSARIRTACTQET